MTKDLTITQEQLEQAVLAEETRTLNVGEARKVAPRLWDRLRKTETEGLLTAAREAYAKNQWQRAADHYAALDSELGQGAPLPGIWGTMHTAELLAAPIPADKAPRPHAWDDITDLGAMQAHLARVHHIEHEGRSAHVLRGIHNGLHGVDDCGRKLAAARERTEPAHEHQDFADDAAGLREHLLLCHQIEDQGAGIGTLRHMHAGAHSPGAGSTAPGSHEHKDYGSDTAAVHWHLRYAHAWLGSTEDAGELRDIHRRFHEKTAGVPHEFADYDDNPTGLREHLQLSHQSGTEDRTAGGLRAIHKGLHEPAEVLAVAGRLSNLCRSRPSVVQRALGYLSPSERLAIASLATMSPEEATSHEH